MRSDRRALAGGPGEVHHGLMGVPLDQRSTTRLALGFVGTVVVPVAIAAAIICYCILQSTSAVVDFVTHIPFF